MLNDKAVLIVEDNIFLALDISSVVEDFEGRVVGPAATALEALRLLESEEIAAAVLGCELADDEVAQVVMQLAEKGIPVVIHTVSGPPPAVLEILPDAPILRAPVQPKVVLARLIEEVAKVSGCDPDELGGKRTQASLNPHANSGAAPRRGRPARSVRSSTRLCP